MVQVSLQLLIGLKKNLQQKRVKVIALHKISNETFAGRILKRRFKKKSFKPKIELESINY